MKRLIFGTISFFACCVAISGQETTGVSCPELTVIGPMGITNPGSSMEFAASVTGLSQPEKLAYFWSVSKGTITGQGTAAIQVSTTKAHQNSNTTATVKITGLPAGCNDTASETGSIAQKLPNEILDEFGRLSKNDVKARIANLYMRLAHAPTYEGLLVVYLNKNEKRRFKMTYLNNLYDAIIWLRKDPSRVSFVVREGEFEIRTDVWTIPPGFDLEEELEIKQSEVVKGEELKAKMKTLFLK